MVEKSRKKLLLLIPLLLAILLIPLFNLKDTQAEAWHQRYRKVWQPKPSSSPTIKPSPTISPTPSPKPTVSPTPTQAPSGNLIKMEWITFYGWVDNDPKGAGIAYSKDWDKNALHSKAGGVGTYDDPITFASDVKVFPVGTKLYVPYLKKYVIMEDYCQTCITHYKNGIPHIDIWMNSNSNNFSSKLISCEEYWTREDEFVEQNPPANRPVDQTPLFNPQTGVCLK